MEPAKETSANLLVFAALFTGIFAGFLGAILGMASLEVQSRLPGGVPLAAGTVLVGLGVVVLFGWFLYLRPLYTEIYRRMGAPKIGPTLAVVGLVAYGDIVSQLENAIIGFFTSIWNGIQSFFGTIFSAIANTFAVIFSAPGTAIQASFNSLSSWAANFGPLAPIITIAIVAAVLLIATLLIWLIIRISTSEGEQTLGEVEEGV